MQICSKCGTINEDNARFCENCGTKLENAKVIREAAAAGQERAGQERAQTMAKERGEMPPADRTKPEAADRTKPKSADRTKPETADRTAPAAPDRKESGGDERQIRIKVPQINIDKLKADGLKAEKSIRGFGKAAGVIAAEAVLLVILLCAFFAVGNAKGDPHNVVKRYFEAYVEGDWPAVYRMTDFPDSDFLQEENYVSFMESAKTDNIINFEVKEKKKKKSEKRELIETYTVAYTVKGESNYRSIELQLLRQNEKTMLFFPVWKVSPEGMVAEDFNIRVPEGSKVVLDRMLLAESDRRSEPGQMRGWDQYQITIFAGNHEIEVAPPWQEVQKQEFSTYNGDFTAEDMRFTDEALDAIEGTVKSAVEQMYQAVFDGSDFSAVAGLFDGDYKQQNQEVYDRLYEDINGRESYRLDQVTFNKFKRSLSDRRDDGSHLILTAHLKYEYSSDYTYTSYSWTNQIRTEPRNDRGTGEVTAGFLYDGGNYKLAWIDMDSVF